MIGASERRDEALIFATIAILWVLGSMALIGPVALTVAAITMTGVVLAGCRIIGAFVVVGTGAAIGMLLWGDLTAGCSNPSRPWSPSIKSICSKAADLTSMA